MLNAGNSLAMLALMTGLGLVFYPVLSGLRRIPASLWLITHGASLQAAFLILVYALVTDDFSVSYVVSHSETSLPLIYKISAAWGGHGSSLLFWVMLQAGWMGLFYRFCRPFSVAQKNIALSFMAMISSGLVGLLLVSSPFAPVASALSPDCSGLNPMLQDAGLIFHPPALCLGYGGLTVVFGMVMSSLLSSDGGKLFACRPWLLVAWSWLTLGIVLGSRWAYTELGWGGWWFWDPVENASLMPWLTATAMLHQLWRVRARNHCSGSLVLLAIATQALILVGTFLVRSGVLTSVHAFAMQPATGVAILGFIVVVAGFSLVLYALRAPANATGKLSGQSLVLLSVVMLLLVACGSILLGTLYPIGFEAFGSGRISVGAPYFNAFFIPLALLLAAILTGFSVHIRQVSLIAIVGEATLFVLAGLVLSWLVAGIGWMTWLVLTMMLWTVWSQLCYVRHQPNKAGAVMAHIGLVLAMAGACLSDAGLVQKEIGLRPGQQETLGGYQFVFMGTTPVRGPNYLADYAFFSVTDDAGRRTDMHPEKRWYARPDVVMTEAAVDSTWRRDLYITLGEPLAQGAWSVRLQVKPFISLLWLGGGLMVLAGFWAVGSRMWRYRQGTESLRASGQSGLAV
ncbi:heme lyase CcmF/NrfE family subunit [Kistimonas scapharcae]